MKIYIIMVLVCFSCSGIKKAVESDSKCKENKRFKEKFFKNIKAVEDFMTAETKTEFKNLDEYESVLTEEKIANFKSSLIFIAKYTHVSFESMANYNGGYPIGVYKKDRECWLKWYEENKCNNIQFKE